MADLRILRAGKGRPAAFGFTTNERDAAAIHDAAGGRMAVVVADPQDWPEAAIELQGRGRAIAVPRLFFPSNDPQSIEAAHTLAGVTGAYVLPPPDKAGSWAEHRDGFTTRGTSFALHRDCPPDVATALPDILAGEQLPPPGAGITVPPAKGPAGGGYGAALATPVVSFTRASDIEPEILEWLWPGWLPLGKLVILAGAPGCGKTTSALAMAATLTVGGRWADGAPCETPGDVAIWSGEDGIADTLIPRLMLAGADLNRVHFPADVGNGKDSRPFDPARDIAALSAAFASAEMANVRLLIVDSIVSAMTGDSHKNNEVRRDLQPLVDMAAERRITVIGITHLSKGTGGRDPVERVNGSIGIGALARGVLVAAKSKTGGARVLCRAKANLQADEGGVEYFIEAGEVEGRPGLQTSRVTWGKVLPGSAAEILAAAEAEPEGPPKGALGEACEALREILADGPRLSTEVEAETERRGIKRGTYDRARKQLDIKSRPVDGVWWTSLPLDPSGGAAAIHRRASQGTQETQETHVQQVMQPAALALDGGYVDL